MLNKCIFIGNVGNDPEIKTMQSGDRVANLSLAVSESWKDKTTGERKTKTEWVRVVVFNQSLVKVIESYVQKGSKIYVEGQMATRSWEQDGVKKYSTEIVMNQFKSELVLLDSKGEKTEVDEPKPEAKKPYDIEQDSIPFMRLMTNQIIGW